MSLSDLKEKVYFIIRLDSNLIYKSSKLSSSFSIQPMDRIINDRNRELSNAKQMLKMQDLLDEYDRENAFLNKQVDTLLKENIKLKQEKISDSLRVSAIKYEDHSATKIKKYSPFVDTYKPSLFTQPRKSRYEYLFDENEIRDFKTNIKNELKNDTKKSLSTKEVQTSTEEIQYFRSSQIEEMKTAQNTPIKKPLETKKLHESKSSLIKPLWERKNEQIKEFEIQNFSKSKSKEKEGSEKKLEVISKSRIYIEKTSNPSKKLITSTPEEISEEKHEEKTLEKTATLTKEFYLEKSDILEHSFGYSPHQNLEKKVTLLESVLPSGLKEGNLINESRMTTKMMPLSIESKELSTNLPKNEERSEFYNEPIIERTYSQSKRRHSLNPSPKVDYQPTQLFNQKVQPFSLITEEAVQLSSIELHRNPSEQKRKFIKIVSSKKIPPAEESPKKK